MSTDALTWLEAPKPGPLLPMRVRVVTRPSISVEERHEYEAVFRSRFDAYDDAMTRFPAAERVVVSAVKGGAK